MSDTVGAELIAWVQAARGALEWHVETGDLDLEIPAGWQMPPLGRIAPAPTPARRPEPSAAQAAVAEVEQPAAAPAERAEPSIPPAPVAGGPQPSIAQAFDRLGGPSADADAGETTFIDSPSLLEGPDDAALVFGWSVVRVAFIAGPVDEQSPENMKAVGELVMRMAQGMRLGLGEVFFGYLAGPGGQVPSAPAARRAVRRQFSVKRPQAIVALGDFAARALCGSTQSFSRTRGSWHTFEDVPVMATFHPEAMLQNADSAKLKAIVWDDLKKVMRRLQLRRQGGDGDG